MEIEFTKMEGLGNDFLIMDDRAGKIASHQPYPELAKKLCSRHFGNGMRCFAKLLYEKKIIPKPHAVIFVEDLESVDVEKIGPSIETHDRFPEKTNVEFIEVVSKTELKMKVWERGAGITLACGTGACAVLVAAHLTGRTEDPSLIHLPGGDLEIHWDKTSNHVFKTGPATLVFEGRVRI